MFVILLCVRDNFNVVVLPKNSLTTVCKINASAAAFAARLSGPDAKHRRINSNLFYSQKKKDAAHFFTRR